MAQKKTKLKLKPSARDKRRYFTTKSTEKKVEEAILAYIGSLGLAEAAYMSIKTKEHPGYVVGSCLAYKLDHVRAALTLQGIKIEKVSGTLKGLKRK